MKVLCSYYSVLNCMLSTRREEDVIDFATLTGVEAFGRTILNFWDVIENADLVLDNMIAYEVATKESLRGERNGIVNLENVRRISGTAGCFLYNYFFLQGPREAERQEGDDESRGTNENDPMGYVVSICVLKIEINLSSIHLRSITDGAFFVF